MYYRQVPPVSSLDRLREIRETVPRDPDAVDDCCGLLIEQCGVSSRTEAEQWLVFLRALGLVETDAGRYYRTEKHVHRTALCSALRTQVAGAASVSDWLSANETETMSGNQPEDDHATQTTSQSRHDEHRSRLYESVENDLPRTVREGNPTGGDTQQVSGEEYVSRLSGWLQELCAERR